jgi:hypothetical protein
VVGGSTGPPWATTGATAGTPDLWAVFNLALIGGRSREFGLFRAGRQGRDGSAEASPSGSPAQPGEVVGAGVSASDTDDDRDEERN